MWAGTGGLARMEVGVGGGGSLCLTIAIICRHRIHPTNKYVFLFPTFYLCVCFTLPVCVFVSPFPSVCCRSFTLPVCVFVSHFLSVCFTLPVCFTQSMCLFPTSCLCVCFPLPVCVFVSHFLSVCLFPISCVCFTLSVCVFAVLRLRSPLGRGKHQVVVNTRTVSTLINVVNTRTVPFLINDVLVTCLFSLDISTASGNRGIYFMWWHHYFVRECKTRPPHWLGPRAVPGQAGDTVSAREQRVY